MALTTGNDYDHIDISDGTNTTRHYLKDTVARDDLIKAQSSQPSESGNKIWFPDTTPEGVEVPTYAEFSDLKSQIDELENLNTVDANYMPNNYIKRFALIPGEYIDASGNPASASGWYRTDYVDISGNSYLTYSGSVGNTAFYGADKSYISTVSGGNKVVDVPTGATFVRASVAEANLGTAMINAGEIVLPYDDGLLRLESYADEKLAVTKHKNLFNKALVKANSYINYTNGAYGSANGYNGSDYIPVEPNMPYTISNLTNSAVGSLAFYTAEKAYISGLANSGIYGKATVTAPGTAYYMRITVLDEAKGNTQVEAGVNQTTFVEYDVKELDGTYYPNRTGHNNIYTDAQPNNLLVKSELIAGCYVGATGAVAYASGWFLSPFIDIGGYSVLTLTGQPGSFCFYDANKAFISQNSSNKTNLAIPSGARYLRVSVAEANINTVNVNANSYALPYDDGHIVVNTKDIRKTIVVDKNGGGDYTSLTEAMYKNYNSGCIFVVRPGVYDLITEFKEYYGATVFDSESFANAGLPINNCDVIMDSAAVITFEYTGTTQSVQNLFSPFKFEGIGGVIKGGNIKSSNCRYAIHDDVYYTSAHSKSIIDGVNIYHRSSTNAAIGGGLGQSSDVLVQNCYIDTGTTDTGYGIFYHNTPTGQGQSYIKILNNYCTSRIMIEPYGESTKESIAIVSNNKCYSVFKQIGGEIDNITMIAYNNDTVA